MADGSVEKKQQKQHALAIPLPGVGHVNPLLRFCHRLASDEGFTITFASIEFAPITMKTEEEEKEALEKKRQEEAESEAAGVSILKDKELDIRHVRLHFDSSDIPAISSLGKQLKAFFRSLSNWAPHIEELLTKLMNAEPPVTCVISDILMTRPTQAVALKMGLPRIAFHTASLSLLLFIHYILQGDLPLNTVLEVLSNKEQAKGDVFATHLPGLPLLKEGDMLDLLDENPSFYEVCVETLRESKEKSLAIAVNTFEELEKDTLSVDFGIPIYAVGPLVDSLDKECSASMREDEDCIKWLDKQPCRSVLYISFGSHATLTKSQYEEIVAGLVSSEQRFLWVFRHDLLKDSSSVDASHEISEKSNGNGYTVVWAPQTRVLAHPAIGGFLTHCGWNSTIEAISHGVPMLCFPYISDQFMNAALIKEVWKVGLGFDVCNESGIPTRSEIERVVKFLMQEEGSDYLRVNAAQYKLHGFQSLQHVHIASKNIKHLVSLI